MKIQNEIQKHRASKMTMRRKDKRSSFRLRLFLGSSHTRDPCVNQMHYIRVVQPWALCFLAACSSFQIRDAREKWPCCIGRICKMLAKRGWRDVNSFFSWQTKNHYSFEKELINFTKRSFVGRGCSPPTLPSRTSFNSNKRKWPSARQPPMPLGGGGGGGCNSIVIVKSTMEKACHYSLLALHRQPRNRYNMRRCHLHIFCWIAMSRQNQHCRCCFLKEWS